MSNINNPSSGGSSSLSIGATVTGGTDGSVLVINPAAVLSQISDIATGNALISGGVGSIPSYGKIGLTTHVSGVLPVANGGTATSTQFTAGSVIFAGSSGVYSQDNANLFWDDTNNRLGINTTTPTQRLTINDGFISLNKGTYNVVIGKDTGAGLTSGSNTTLIGGNIGGSSTITGNNVIIGSNAVSNGASDHNVVIGDSAGSSIGSGTSNVLIGASANIVSSGPVVNAVGIGANVIVTQTNTVILGEGSADVGIGISDPRAKVEIADVNELGDNVILNGTFEVNTDDWTAEDSTLASIAGGSLGDNCLEITNIAFPGSAYQEFPTKPNRRYVLSYSYAPGTEQTGNLEITSDGDTVYEADLFNDDQWLTATANFISNGTDSSIIYLRNTGSNGSTFLFDNIIIREVIGGDLIANGDLNALSVRVGEAAGYISSDGSTGASGTFTTVDLKTVTVKDGIITAIV